MNQNDPATVRDPRRVTGVVLIVIGLLLFALQIATGITVSLLFLVGGAIFIAAYFNKRTYGLLIPGCLLVGMGLGQLGEEYVDFIHNPNFVGLGLGFLAIFAIDKIHTGTTAWWPLIPGFIMLFMGLETGSLNLGTLFSKGWPLVLVIVGILYFAGKIGTGRGGGGEGPPQ